MLQRRQSSSPALSPALHGGPAQDPGAHAAAGGPGNAALAALLQQPIAAVGSDKDPEEGAADQLADAVLDWVGHAAGALGSETPQDNGAHPAGFVEAFQQLAGFDIRGVKVHGHSREKTAQHDAQALAQDGEVHLSGALGADDFTLAHELAHVALGHAAKGAPVRRKATTSGDPGIGLSGYLRYGDRSSMVETLQTLLVRLGYMTAAQKATGPGIFGRRTRAAVTAFQRAKRLTVDGIVGPQTIGALAKAINAGNSSGGGGERGSSALTGRPALREGMEGVLVKELQKALNTYGGGLYIDGEFGPKTAAAVRGFQSANGLTVDGIVGPNTAGKLTSGSAKKISEAGKGSSPGGPVKVDVDDADPRGLLADSRINPTVRQLATTTIKTMQSQGHSPYVVGGFRSFSYQNDLYAQGRTKPGQKVTYVKGGGSWHNYGLAVDIVFWNKSHTGPSWDGGLPWQALGRAGKQAGFTRWMGDSGWDFAHFEHHPKWGNSCYNLASTYHNHGLSEVWRKVM